VDKLGVSPTQAVFCLGLFTKFLHSVVLFAKSLRKSTAVARTLPTVPAQLYRVLESRFTLLKRLLHAFHLAYKDNYKSINS
jgi:hypothetical protein